MLIKQRSVTIDGQSLSEGTKEALLGVHGVLRERFPHLHASLRVDAVADYSLLYEWTGSDPSLDPVVLIAHLDVVPVPPEQESDWVHAPFGGEVIDGEVWGRGALDVKGRVVAHLAAVEALLEAGMDAPERTIFLSYGHDEEIGGAEGATALAAEIERRLGGRRVAALLDEGGAVTSGAVPGMPRALEGAMVGTAEKGSFCIKLRAESRGGHAAFVPLNGTPVTAVARAVAALHTAPSRPRLTPPVVEMLERVSPLVDEPYRTLFANLDVFGGVIARAFASHAEKANSLVRTTYTATTSSAGLKKNVVPALAETVINVRPLPGESVEAALGAVRDAVEPFGVTAEVDHEAFIAQATAPDGTGVNPAAWAALERAIHRVYGWDTIVTLPFIMLGTTDSKHFLRLADVVYRIGQRMSDAAIDTIHGVDERESAEGIAEQAMLFAEFIELYCFRGEAAGVAAPSSALEPTNGPKAQS